MNQKIIRNAHDLLYTKSRFYPTQLTSKQSAVCAETTIQLNQQHRSHITHDPSSLVT